MDKEWLNWKYLLAVIIFTLFATLLYASLVKAEEINVNALANAIYKAENSKNHPYGILAHYQHTSPRQACINTIKHALRDWNKEGDFIVFLGLRYCPPNAHPLNKNWVKNVKYYYGRYK